MGYQETLRQNSNQSFLFRKNDAEVFLPTRAQWRNNAWLLSPWWGKMKHGDITSLESLRREKNEELGEAIKIRVLPFPLAERLLKSADGPWKKLLYYYAEYMWGTMNLSLQEYEKYSKADWISTEEVLKADKSLFVEWTQEKLMELLSIKKEFPPEFVDRYAIQL